MARGFGPQDRPWKWPTAATAILSFPTSTRLTRTLLIPSRLHPRRRLREPNAPLRMPSLPTPNSEEALLAELSAQAKARRVTKSPLVREGLNRVLFEKSSSRPLSCFDLAHDLAGKIVGLPEDLADNPKYMDRFGQ